MMDVFVVQWTSSDTAGCKVYADRREAEQLYNELVIDERVSSASFYPTVLIPKEEVVDAS